MKLILDATTGTRIKRRARPQVAPNLHTYVSKLAGSLSPFITFERPLLLFPSLVYTPTFVSTHTMLSRLLLPSLLLLSSTSLATAQSNGPSQCISFDASWNLLAFNFDGKDYNAGTALDSSSPAQDITSTSNRPPFDVTSSSPLCFLSKFTNSVYVLNADASDKSAVYIYDAAAKSWSKQQTGGAVPKSFSNDAEGNFATILDHDTNVFYAMTGTKMLSLDMALLKAASGEEIPWNEVGEPSLSAEASSEGYVPTMALGQNHIHFLGVPGLGEGDAKVFVIHFSYLQPEVQSYGSFPNSHGRTASFFKNEGVQTQFAYIPDDGSNTYVVDVIGNSTTRIPGPSTKDPKAMYATSPFALVQLASQGAVQWIGYDQDARVGTTWQALNSLPKVTGSGSISGPTSGNGPKGSSSGSNTTGAGGSSNATNAESADDGSAVSVGSRATFILGVVVATMVGLAGFAF
ncbi:hypothetical protein BKA70DRAFT_856615 [Coprinopsis sp. MPI-PUGE-AT-0042]|nr:hypothetical protein BKA70DRAFT_856615 [Coprinopsis sp. MPI-PUGE-AT-0042]